MVAKVVALDNERLKRHGLICVQENLRQTRSNALWI